MTASQAMCRARVELDLLVAGALERAQDILERRGATPAEVDAEVAVQAAALAVWRVQQLRELERFLSDSRVVSGRLH